jgi:hypothetical protein
MTACREDQKSYIGKGDHTIFTQALVDGLRGRGVGNRNGYVSAFSLYEHVFETVAETVAGMNKNLAQEPELTVLKGVGPFAVALYRGASALGDGALDQPLPETPAVHEVSEKRSVRIFNQHVEQSGGVNFGQGNQIDVAGSVVAGDQVNAEGSQGFINRPGAPVEQHFGSRVDTGGGTHVAGDVNISKGDFVGRDKKVYGDEVRGNKVAGDSINVGDISGSQGVAIGRGAQSTVTTTTTAASVSPDQFTRLLQELRNTLATANLDSDEKEAVQQDLDRVAAQVAKERPKLSLITSGLNNVKSVIEAATGVGAAAAALSSLVQQALNMAQQLFK